MGGDDYVIDENGSWESASEALVWYRQALADAQGKLPRAELIEAARQSLIRYEAHLYASPIAAIGYVWQCACLGPLPECECKVERRLVREFMGAEFEQMCHLIDEDKTHNV